MAILGILACLLTRGPDEPSPLADGQMTFQGWARFPLGAGVAIVGLNTLPGIGLDAGPFISLTFLVAIITALVHPKLPVVPVPLRRAMVLPMALVAAGAFNQMVGGGLADLVGQPRARAPPIPPWPASGPLILGAIGTLYVILVVAPRSIADPGASGPAWGARFLLLLAGLALGGLIAG